MQVTFNITRGHTIALFKVITLGLLLGFGIQFLFAWTAPTTAAPGGNVGGPLTVSSDEQFKKGPLTINADVLPSTVGSAYGLVVSQNVLVGGKVRSGSTLADDPGQTLVTKDYLDAKIDGMVDQNIPVLLYGGNYTNIYTTNAAANGSGLPSTLDGCHFSNEITGKCSCPTGYKSKKSDESQLFVSYPWDKTLVSYTCYKKI